MCAAAQRRLLAWPLPYTPCSYMSYRRHGGGGGATSHTQPPYLALRDSGTPLLLQHCNAMFDHHQHGGETAAWWWQCAVVANGGEAAARRRAAHRQRIQSYVVVVGGVLLGKDSTHLLSLYRSNYFERSRKGEKASLRETHTHTVHNINGN